MFWLGAYIRKAGVMVKRMAGSSATKCGLVKPYSQGVDLVR